MIKDIEAAPYFGAASFCLSKFFRKIFASGKANVLSIFTIKDNFAKKCIAVQTETFEEIETDVIVELDKPFQIVVWNDEVNTFEWVIETLTDVCGHSHEQAEQCALFIHNKGKYAVKKGGYDDLKPQTDAITERGIGATLEVTA